MPTTHAVVLNDLLCIHIHLFHITHVSPTASAHSLSHIDPHFRCYPELWCKYPALAPSSAVTQAFNPPVAWSGLISWEWGIPTHQNFAAKIGNLIVPLKTCHRRLSVTPLKTPFHFSCLSPTFLKIYLIPSLSYTYVAALSLTHPYSFWIRTYAYIRLNTHIYSIFFQFCLLCTICDIMSLHSYEL